MKTRAAVLLLCLLSLACVKPLVAQEDDLAGLWQGYNGEWDHVSRHIVELAEAIPADKYSWRPAPHVRSVSEVLMHIASANFYLLSITGPKLPADFNDNLEKTVTSKPEVISWLKRSLAAVKDERAKLKPADFQRHVTVFKRDATVDGMYLRIIVHVNEHTGQMIAYARTMGVVPPWSKS
jgi:uncharacterized damage-inducible protein DinB